jgi:hypothetical protein
VKEEEEVDWERRIFSGPSTTPEDRDPYPYIPVKSYEDQSEEFEVEMMLMEIRMD